MKISIVTTSIHGPQFIQEYCKNLKEHNHEEEINFIVIGDNKTPEDKWKIDFDYSVKFWSLYHQKEWFNSNKIENLVRFFPENNPRRRNFGYIQALLNNPDIIISIDDDNLPDGDWLSGHINALKSTHLESISSNNIINPCEILDTNHKIFSRGYPISEISIASFGYSPKRKIFKEPVVNLGLWSKSPDVDCLLNLVYPDIESKGIEVGLPRNFSTNQYLPLNTQNISFKREIAPIFWNVYMKDLFGLPFDRYDDIWNGLFINKICNHLGLPISFGDPISIHDRNVHNLIKDLQIEYIGILLNSKLWKYVMNLQLKESDIIGSYLELSNFIVKQEIFFNSELKKYFKELGESMKLWILILEKLKCI